MRLRGDSQSLIEDVRRHPVRVCNVRNTHPRSDNLVSMRTPIDSAANGADGKETSYQYHQHQCRHHDPFLPSVRLHLLARSVESNSDAFGSGKPIAEIQPTLSL